MTDAADRADAPSVLDLAAWQEANNAFIATALAELRARVARLTPPPPAAEPAPPRPRRIWQRSAPDPIASAGPPAAVSERDVTQASEAVARAAGTDPPPALLRLQELTGLSDFERDVLLLAAGPEFDPTLGALYARALGGRGDTPTFALALAALEDGHWEALGPHRPLRHLHLIEVGSGEGIINAPLRADERVVNFIKGLGHLDERLASLIVEWDVDTWIGPTASQEPAVAASMRLAEERGHQGLVNLVGGDGPSKQIVGLAAASRLGLHLVRLPVANLPPSPSEAGLLMRIWERERLLAPVALYLDADDPATEGAPDPGIVDRLAAQLGGVVFLDSREVWRRLPSRSAVVDVTRPDLAEQRVVWAEGLTDPDLAAAAAAEFDLDQSSIAAIASSVPREGGHASARLREACRARCRPRLDQLAERVVPMAGWDDLVVPADVREGLVLIEQQLRGRAVVHDEWRLASQSRRGLGVSVLFSGESGTGKTMAAEVLAGRLDLDLYRIDLSAVVSKYIGETEKNLRRMFDAADRGGSILFFDEADALFGRRSEVRDSHDRYANIEVSYLLQRMEEHRGLAILATNMKQALDAAFARRLRFVVDFPFPSEPDRALIWSRSFPPGAPIAGLDLARLGRLTLAGGAIRTAALNAAFAAADTPSGAVTMPLVLAAARREYRKLNLAGSERDFDWAPPPADAALPAMDGAAA